MHGSTQASNTAATCDFISRQSPLYTYGGSTMRPSHPRSVAAFARATASEVLSAEIAATTGARCSTARTQVRRISSFSANDRVAPSPNDPRAKMPAQPLSRSQRQCSAIKPWSIPRFFVKHVVIAGITPFQFMNASYDRTVFATLRAVISDRLSTRTGKIGGRKESTFQLNRNWVAVPQTLPWHGPIPQRVCNFAARHEVCSCKREYEISSQRQTMVSAVASFLSSERRWNARSRMRAKLLAFLR